MVMTTVLIDLERVVIEDDNEKIQALLDSIADLCGYRKETLIERMKAAQMSQLGRCDEWV